jgi:hypothetical protein
MNKDNQLISERYKIIILKENAQDALGFGENGLGEKPEKIKGEWQKIQEKISEEKYYKTPIYYIANMSLNSYENSRYYNNLNDAWKHSCGSAYNWAYGDKYDDDDLLKKIREAEDKPVPKWFKDLYWDRIDKRIVDEFGTSEFGY